MRMDGRTDGHDTLLIFACRNFANAPKKLLLFRFAASPFCLPEIKVERPTFCISEQGSRKAD